MPFPLWLTDSWLIPPVRRHLYYNAIIAVCQAIANDVTSTHGHGGLGLATGACDNLCPTSKLQGFQLGVQPWHPRPNSVSAQVVHWCRRFSLRVLVLMPLFLPTLILPPTCPSHTVHHIHCCHSAHGFVVMLWSGKKRGRAQRWLMYGFWRGNRAEAMSESGNVRMASCPLSQAYSQLYLEAAFFSCQLGGGG